MPEPYQDEDSDSQVPDRQGDPEPSADAGGAADVPGTPSSPEVPHSVGTPDVTPADPNQSGIPSSPSAGDISRLLTHTPHSGYIKPPISKPVDNDCLQLSAAEIQQLAAATSPGWKPPTPEVTESVEISDDLRHVMRAANHLFDSGRSTIKSAEVGDILVILGLFPPNKAYNGIGDKLGKGGLRLKRVLVKGGNAYKRPDCGRITAEYLKEIGFSV
jgi:hypothetical protein